MRYGKTDPYLSRSCVPAGGGKTQKSEYASKHQPGMKNRMRVKAGNNENVNTAVLSADIALDKSAAERQAAYTVLRRTDSYKLARAAAKRAKRSPWKRDRDESVDRSPPVKHMDFEPVVRKPTIVTPPNPYFDTWGQRTIQR